MVRLFAALLILLASGAPSLAAFLELGDDVPGHPGTSVRSLLAQVIIGLTATTGGEVGGTVPQLRHIMGEDWQEKPPAVPAIGSIEAVPFRSGGKDLIVLKAELGQPDSRLGPMVLLAVYGSDLALVDAVDIGLDRLTALRSPATVPISPDDDMLVAISSHFNSSQSYDSYLLIRLADERLTLIDEIGLFGSRECAADRYQSLDLATTPDAANAHWSIVATVWDESVPTGNDCGDTDQATSPAAREITVTYGWDHTTERYTPDSDAFVRLAEENSARY